MATACTSRIPGRRVRNRCRPGTVACLPPASGWRGEEARGLDYDFEAIYQTGLARETTAITDTRDLNVSAYFFHGEAGYTFAAPWLPRVALQYDHGSGDSSNPNTFTRFDTLFGVRREYNPVDLYGPLQRSNMISPAIRFEVTPSPVWDAFVAYRTLFLADRTDSFGRTQVRDRTGRSGNFAGHQIEARLRYWVVPDAMLLETGAAYLFKGRFLQDAPNAPDTADTALRLSADEFLLLKVLRDIDPWKGAAPRIVAQANQSKHIWKCAELVGDRLKPDVGHHPDRFRAAQTHHELQGGPAFHLIKVGDLFWRRLVSPIFRFEVRF